MESNTLNVDSSGELDLDDFEQRRILQRTFKLVEVFDRFTSEVRTTHLKKDYLDFEEFSKL